MPTSLLINEHVWRVDYQTDAQMPDTEGQSIAALKTIRIRRGQCLAEEQDSLWHEVHHALVPPDVDQDKTKWTIHKSIEGFTPAELHVMHDNPELVRYLIQ